MPWFGKGSNVYGWYVGLRDGTPEASYFDLPDYYAVKPAVLYRSAEDDLRGPWVQVTRCGESELPHTLLVSETLCHELARCKTNSSDTAVARSVPGRSRSSARTPKPPSTPTASW